MAFVWALKNRKTGIRILCKRIDIKKCTFLLGAGLILVSLAVGVYHHGGFRPSSAFEKNKKSSLQAYPTTEPIFRMSTLNERIWLWKKTFEMVKKHPLMGIGVGQWRLAFPIYGKIQKFRQSDDGPIEIFFQRPHNDYIWILSESGIIGLLSYLAIFGISINYALKIFFQSGDADNKALAFCMLFGIIGYMVISFFSFPRERIVHVIFLMLIMACIVSAYHQVFRKQKNAKCYRILFVNIFALLLLVFCMIVGYIRLDSEAHVKEALVARRTGDWQTVRSEIDKADSPFYQLDPLCIPLAWYRGIANYSTGHFEEALKDFKKAYQIHPNNIHVLNNLGTGYAKLGDFESAVAYYEKALEICPGFAEARVNLGVVYFHMGNFFEARYHLMHLNHNYEDAKVSVSLQFNESR
jgi:tetratricopeptide (TPR) repeat protein